MEKKYADLGKQIFILINGPLVFLSLAANTFYTCCFIFPPRNVPRLKQPLKMLLDFLVWCSICYCVSLASLYCVFMQDRSFEMYIVSWTIMLFFVQNSMTCSVWLTFYYYIQIVPAQCALMIWVKRNIKSVMYMALLFDVSLFSFSSAIFTANNIFQAKMFLYINGTHTGHQIDGLYIIYEVCLVIVALHVFLSLCIMTVSSFSMTRYLHRHIQSVAHGFSNPRIQSQMRVNITGISQGVLYFLYAIFCLYGFFSSYTYSSSGVSSWVSYTCSTLYISGTTVNLGIGQAVCRQRAADAWKAFKALCGAGMVSHDMKMHSSSHTSGEKPNTATVDVQISE